jgi:hypothetical protein
MAAGTIFRFYESVSAALDTRAPQLTDTVSSCVCNSIKLNHKVSIEQGYLSQVALLENYYFHH